MKKLKIIVFATFVSVLFLVCANISAMQSKPDQQHQTLTGKNIDIVDRGLLPFLLVISCKKRLDPEDVEFLCKLFFSNEHQQIREMVTRKLGGFLDKESIFCLGYIFSKELLTLQEKEFLCGIFFYSSSEIVKRLISTKFEKLNDSMILRIDSILGENPLNQNDVMSLCQMFSDLSGMQRILAEHSTTPNALSSPYKDCSNIKTIILTKLIAHSTTPDCFTGHVEMLSINLSNKKTLQIVISGDKSEIAIKPEPSRNRK